MIFVYHIPMSGRKSNVERCLRAVADAVISASTFRFIDPESGVQYDSPSSAPRDAALALQSPYNDWRYWNGVLNIGMRKAGEAVKDATYRSFPDKNIAFCFDHAGYFRKKYKGDKKWVYPFAQHYIIEELDDCGAMGASLIEIYRYDKQKRYRKYIERAADHIMNKQHRLKDGTFVRHFPCYGTIWADDCYMSVSFLSRMGELEGLARFFDEAVIQVLNFHSHLFDGGKGICRHCWFSHTGKPGVAFWGRANGWILLAQVDLLDRLPEEHPDRPRLISIFRKEIEGIVRYQDTGGFWHQLLDREDSFPETSCSAMLTYAIARAINVGYVDESFKTNARNGWKGLESVIGPDGTVFGTSTGTCIGGDLHYYYKRPRPVNDIHGIGPVILAASEILAMS